MPTVSEAAAQTILEAMALVVGSDDEGRTEETASFASVYHQMTGQPVDEVAMAMALLMSGNSPELLWEALNAKCDQLTGDEKNRVIQAATQMCIMDAELQAEEVATLNRMFRALGMDVKDVRLAMRDAWRASKGG
jgi:hypothetical protein